MKIENRESLVKLLECAKEKGALKSVSDISMRDIRIETAGGEKFRIEWYCSFCTLKSNGFYMWFDGVEISDAHKDFDIALRISCGDTIIGHIGKVSKCLTDSFEV